MSAYRLSRLADQDLVQIFGYTIETFGIDQALTYKAEIEAIFALLAEHPSMGRDVSELRPGLRRHEHAAHVIFYSQIDNGVLVIRVLGFKQKPKPQLMDDGTDETQVIAGIERGLADMRAGHLISNEDAMRDLRQTLDRKLLGVDVMTAAEAGIEDAVRVAKEQAWLAESADAIRAHNERIDKFGTLLKPIWAPE